MTALARGPLLDGLPADAESLCRLSRELIVHELAAHEYGVTNVAERVEELETRSAAAIIAAISALDSRSLAQPRPPERRLLGNCRQFTVLTCALLRHAGIPARARAGFAAYLDEGAWTEHWIVERWAGGRWLRTDPQLDDLYRDAIGYTFDPLDLPAGQFLPAGEAWRRYRDGDDPSRYGIGALRGPWMIQGNVLRDLAALCKVEMLPWDAWGAMIGPGEEFPEAVSALTDLVAAAIGDDFESSVDLRGLYRQDNLRVPEVVLSARFRRQVAVGSLSA